MTLEEAVKVLRKEYECKNKDCELLSCSDCPLYNDSNTTIEAYRIILEEYERGICDSETEGGD